MAMTVVPDNVFEDTILIHVAFMSLPPNQEKNGKEMNQNAPLFPFEIGLMGCVFYMEDYWYFGMFIYV